MRIPDRAEWKVLIDKVLYTSETGIFNWDGYTYQVNGTDILGGLCGVNAGFISNCYAAGTINGVDILGGLCGYNYGLFTNCSWDKDIAGITDGVGNQYPDPAGVTGKTTVQMQTKSTFTDAGWDFTDIWRINDGHDYPRLLWKPWVGDFNNDEKINLYDFAIMSEAWLSSAGDADYNISCDLSADNTIDIADLNILVQNWLRGSGN